MRRRFMRGSTRPALSMLSSSALPNVSAKYLPVRHGFSVNCRINGKGRPGRWKVEYGATDAYGSSTSWRELPPKLEAYYEEPWTSGLNGFMSGHDLASSGGNKLSHQATGGPSNGPFVRYNVGGDTSDDTNHTDNLGTIHLGLIWYCGHNMYTSADPPRAVFGGAEPDHVYFFLGGGKPDFRGARLSVAIRGNAFDANGSTIGAWIQGMRDPAYANLGSPAVMGRTPHVAPNWAFRADQTDVTTKAALGTWQTIERVFRNRTDDWQFAGANRGRPAYDYGELDTQLRNVVFDLFPFQILEVDSGNRPTGTLDYANFLLSYRQHNMCCATNGGALLSEPAGGTGSAYLTDGYRNGTGREWLSAVTPAGNQDFVYAFDEPILVSSILVHNSVAKPSRAIQIDVSENGGGAWTTVFSGDLPQTSTYGANHLFRRVDAFDIDARGDAVWDNVHPNAVNRVRVRVTSGWQADYWGLGEIEVFGETDSGALVKQTDVTAVDMSRDVLAAPGVHHYRVVVETDLGTVNGPDQTVTVDPATTEPSWGGLRPRVDIWPMLATFDNDGDVTAVEDSSGYATAIACGGGAGIGPRLYTGYEQGDAGSPGYLHVPLGGQQGSLLFSTDVERHIKVTPPLGANGAFTWFFGARLNEAPSADRYLLSNAAGNVVIYAASTGGKWKARASSTAGEISSTVDGFYADGAIICLTSSGESSPGANDATVRLFVNSKTASATQTGRVRVAAGTELMIGNRFATLGTTNALKGQVGRAMFFDSELSQTDREEILDALAAIFYPIPV